MLTPPSSRTEAASARPVLDRYYWGFAIALLVAHAALAWLTRAGILTTGDDSTYVLLARSLRAFQYRDIFQINTPVHNQYPPVYPAMLAAWAAVGTDRFNWLVLVGIGSSVGALAVFASAVRDLWGPRVALAALLALAPNPSLIASAGVLLAESPFILFETVALWALTRETTRPHMSLVAGAAAIAAALTRSVGVTLIGALALYWLWRRRYRTVVVFAISATLTVGLWIGWTIVAPRQAPGQSYIADATVRPAQKTLARALIDRVMAKKSYGENLYWQLPMPRIPVTTAIDNWKIGAPIVGVGLLAGFALLWTSWPAAVIYLVAYGALLLVWPYFVIRFLVPVLPWAVLALLIGISAIARVLRPRWETPALFLMALILASTGAASTSGVVERQHACDLGSAVPSRSCLNEDQASFFAAIDYVRDHLPADAIFLSGKPSTIYYYTGRRSVWEPLALAHPPFQTAAFLRGLGVTHVLLSGVAVIDSGLTRMLKTDCAQLQLEASFPPSAFLFRLPADDRSSDSAAACRAVADFVASEPGEGER